MNGWEREVACVCRKTRPGRVGGCVVNNGLGKEDSGKVSTNRQPSLTNTKIAHGVISVPFHPFHLTGNSMTYTGLNSSCTPEGGCKRQSGSSACSRVVFDNLFSARQFVIHHTPSTPSDALQDEKQREKDAQRSWLKRSVFLPF